MGAKGENASDVESINTQAAGSTAAPQPTTYKSIDIRLQEEKLLWNGKVK